MVPGVEIFGAPGWLMPELSPVVVPVAVVDGPPGADEMPADPGLVVPTGGTPPIPGATWVCAAPAAPLCAKAAGIAPSNDKLTAAAKCSLFPMKLSSLMLGSTRRESGPFLTVTSLRSQRCCPARKR